VRRRLVLCGRCGFLRAGPRPDPRELAAHYASSRASGSTWHATGPGSRIERLLADRTRAVVRAMEALEAERPSAASLAWLDVGCGGGELLDAVRREGWRRSGLDPDPGAAAGARSRGLAVRAEALEDAEPVAHDLVSCVSCLEHAWDVEGFVARLARCVRPGGWLFASVPDTLRAEPQVAEFFGYEHLSHFTPATLRRLLARHRLAVAHVERTEGPALQVLARRTGESIPRSAAAEREERAQRTELAEVMRRYAEERAGFERDLRERLEPRVRGWVEGGRRVGVYGAGEHTRYLLDLVPLRGIVRAILDGDPAKLGSRFLDWEVRAPEEAGALGLDAVVLSSRPFQDEMEERLAPTAAEHGIEVLRCYPRGTRPGGAA